MAVDVESLNRTYGPMVLRRCRKMLRNEQEAVEAMQETFVAVLRNQERLVETAPRSLLFTMATNTCLNRIRTRKRKPEHPGDELLQTIAMAPDVDERAWARVIGMGDDFRQSVHPIRIRRFRAVQPAKSGEASLTVL